MMNVNESATTEPRALASVSVPYHILPLPSTTARSTSTRQPQTPSSSHGIGFTYAKDRINLLAPYMFTSASFGQRLQTSQRLAVGGSSVDAQQSNDAPTSIWYKMCS